MHSAKVEAESAKYQPIPTIIDFTDENGNDTIQQQIQLNYDQIKADVQNIVDQEIARIKANPTLQHLIKR